MQTSPTTIKTIGSQLTNKMAYLYDRWIDEREYEDFKDYANFMQKEAENIDGVKFIKATKMPFGFKFEFNSKKFHFTANSKLTKIKPIA